MSTATPVPETRDLDSEDARATLRSCGTGQLLRDAFIRLRVSDGFSHARSLAYATALVLVQGIVSVVGLATALGSSAATHLIVRTLHGAVPGPGGELLTRTVTQGHDVGATHRYAGLVFGLLGALIAGSTMMGQFERGFNRLYGVEQDRPTTHKYGLALILTITAGALAAFAFAALALGESIGNSMHNRFADRAWAIARWPLGLLLVIAAMTLLLHWSPRRRQPHLSWLAFGATVSGVLWAVVTLALGLFFARSGSFGDTYGPLAGIVALLLWSLLSAIAVLFGGAVAAQLEAVRAGRTQPQDPEKVEHSEPDEQRRVEISAAS